MRRGKNCRYFSWNEATGKKIVLEISQALLWIRTGSGILWPAWIRIRDWIGPFRLSSLCNLGRFCSVAVLRIRITLIRIRILLLVKDRNLRPRGFSVLALARLRFEHPILHFECRRPAVAPFWAPQILDLDFAWIWTPLLTSMRSRIRLPKRIRVWISTLN